jgi:hypothetical protein
MTWRIFLVVGSGDGVDFRLVLSRAGGRGLVIAGGVWLWIEFIPAAIR